MAFEVHHPESVEQAIRLAGELAPHARFLAGGTDLIIQINRKRRAPRHLIALGGIDGLSGIELRDGEMVLGALTTHKAIERCAHFDGRLAVLAEAARVVGGHQVRNVATIGGNVVNASPAADLLPPLLALDAAVVLAGSRGTRHVPIAQFLRGPGSTERAEDEILLRIAFPCPSEGAATAFIKAGRRRAMEISVVSVAAVLELDGSHRCRTARIALGAVGPVAMRVPEAEIGLQGHEPTEAAFSEAGRLAAAACAPISDVRASAEYRRMLIQALVPRALRRCLQRIEARSR
ncbi:MAG: aerobic carbon-monoxide dehydrogenase medium subunit [Acetobacteraceae bacterium]|jgi:carbon-monoxide dehydrogenase medium subunit|nr:aerobic carbon-monoxide dehydrogenase medium subunit [Acetobacteraceae bacterium]